MTQPIPPAGRPLTVASQSALVLLAVRSLAVPTLCALILVAGIPLRAESGDDGWSITASNIDPAAYHGVTVANGMIGLVSSTEPLKIKEVVLNGVYDRYGRGRVSNILKGINFADMRLDIDGKEVRGDQVARLTQRLDMRAAQLTTSFDVQDKATVRSTIMALRHLPYTAMILFEVTARRPIAVTPYSLMRAPDILRDVRNHYAEVDRPHARIPLMTSVAKSPTGRLTVAASTSFIFEGDGDTLEQDGDRFEGDGDEAEAAPAHSPGGSPARPPRLVHEEWDTGLHILKFTRRLEAGETVSFAVVGSEVSSAQFDDPQNEAERLTLYAVLEGRDRLLAKHRAAWDDLWTGDIRIEGDPGVQRDVRLALYHLYSFARQGTAYSLSPMGLSGLGYNGHVFWDTELWIEPPLLMLQPGIARSLLEYRFRRLDAARQNAFSHGYAGAMFPWESADSGMEETPVWALTGPFEHHITSEVGWAFWKYWQATGDREFLRTRAYPVLEAVADYWVSRVERDAQGRYHINNVVAADEYAENVDDNAFTNGGAITTLRQAARAARLLGIAPDRRWEEVAERIVLLRFADGVTREHATYDGEPIKQADVNLLAYPLQVITDPATIRKDLDYYERVMDPEGPAMGPAVLSVLHARLGDAEKAYALFLRAYQPNRVPPFGVLAETAGGDNPYFATGAGGMLQAVLAGFGGLEITDRGITQLKTPLPKAWRSLTITGVGPQRRTFAK